MAEGALSKKDFGKLAAAVGKEAAFLGPVKGDDSFFSEVDSKTEVDFERANSSLPLKRLFFPQSEALYTYDGDQLGKLPLPEEKVVVFGARPCDARALLQLDKVLLGEPAADPYYQRRRENTTVIALACGAPAPTCFCTSVTGGPHGKEGADVLASDLGDALLFESVSPKGEAFMKVHAGLFANAKPEMKTAKEKQLADAAKKIAKINIDGLAEKLKACYDSPIWAELTERCLDCGACTYSCPTCHCFGIYDETAGAKGKCIRVQDACMFPGFTLEVSGHNPRRARGERMRQRIMHKFRYTVENFGETFCVGCGRCVAACPVNLDVRETVSIP